MTLLTLCFGIFNPYLDTWVCLYALLSLVLSLLLCFRSKKRFPKLLWFVVSAALLVLASVVFLPNMKWFGTAFVVYYAIADGLLIGAACALFSLQLWLSLSEKKLWKKLLSVWIALPVSVVTFLLAAVMGDADSMLRSAALVTALYALLFLLAAAFAWLVYGVIRLVRSLRSAPPKDEAPKSEPA